MGSLQDNVLHIPVIDLSNATEHTGDDLVKATSQWGFVFIRSIGSGFTPDTVNRTFDLVRPQALNLGKILMDSNGPTVSWFFPTSRRREIDLCNRT